MIYIDPSQPDLINAKDIHFKNIKCYINKKIGGNLCPVVLNCNICNSTIKKLRFKIQN